MYYYSEQNTYMGYQKAPGTAKAWWYYGDALPDSPSTAQPGDYTTLKRYAVDAEGTPDPRTPQDVKEQYLYLNAPWYKMVQSLQKTGDPYKAGNANWTKPMVFSNGKMGVSVIHKVTDPKDWTTQWGIFGADYELAHLSGFLDSASKSAQGSTVAFLMDSEGDLIASSKYKDALPATTSGTGQAQKPLAASKSDCEPIKLSAEALTEQVPDPQKPGSKTTLIKAMNRSETKAALQVQDPPPPLKRDKSSRGSVDTTKTRSGPQRVRMCKDERPIGGSKGLLLACNCGKHC